MQRNRLVRRGKTNGIADRPDIIRSDGGNAIQTIHAVVANVHNIRDGYSLPNTAVPVQSQVVPGIVFKEPANRPKIIVAAACDRAQTSAVPGHVWRRDHGPACWAGGRGGSGKRRLSRCIDWPVRSGWCWSLGFLGS